MRIRAVLFSVSFALFTPLAPAAEFSTGFGAGYNYSGEVSGQNEWIINDPTPDLSFFVKMNGSDAAALGGFYDAPGGPGTTLSHPVDIPADGSCFRASFAVLPSTQQFPGRDTFGWTFTDPAGVVLYTLRFIPAATNPDLLNIMWKAGSGNLISTGWAVSYSALYGIDLRFAAAGSDLAFTAVIAGANNFSFTGVLPGMAGETWGGIGADFMVEDTVYGDNFVAFDDLSFSPLSMVDTDGDGYSVEMETWFGTSDSSRQSSPAPRLSLDVNGATLTFPSVAGNAYIIEWSENLTNWTVAEPVTATDSSTSWQEPALSATRRYFRVRKP
jgi:hypothetical protein